MNKLLALSADERERGIVAASSGNHGAAVAHGIRKLDCEGTIFVPQGASQAKVDAIRSFGATVQFEGEDSGLTEVAARRWAFERGKEYISPYNDFEVVAGQGTLGLEMLRFLGDFDAVLLALGGGGLISGVASYLKAHLPSIEVVACSPINSAVMYESLRCGRILESESKPTLSDGTAGGVEPGAITFDLCQQLIDHHILVSEEEIQHALIQVLSSHHMLIEGAAAVPVAALLKEAERFRGRRTGVVLCGANISTEKLIEVLQRA
jgi:threonine dehydratase